MARQSSKAGRLLNTDVSGVYSDPRVALITPASLSPKTQDILNTIQSLITNEAKAIGATFREKAGVDLGLEPEEALPGNTRIIDLSTDQHWALSKETREAGQMDIAFDFWSRLASMDAEKLSNTQTIVFGDRYVGMTEEELINDRINAMVESQVNAVRRSLEMARSDAFQRFTADTETPTSVGEPLTETDLEALRADLLAKRWDEFQRGELRIRTETFSSVHALNYEKTYATLDTAGDGMVVQPENGVTFDEAWTMSDRDKQSFGGMFDGITVEDGELVFDPGKADFYTEMGLEFLRKHGEIGLEYLRDARA